MKAYKQCYGCRSLREKSCDYQKYMYKDCPCSNCLIKSVCITACDVYEEILDWHHKEISLKKYLKEINTYVIKKSM